jgi:hypothetical protein
MCGTSRDYDSGGEGGEGSEGVREWDNRGGGAFRALRIGSSYALFLRRGVGGGGGGHE